MGPNERIELLQMNEKAEELIEEIFLYNGYNLQIDRREVDFFAEKEGKKYVIEVKRGDFDTGRIYAIANNLKEYAQRKHCIPILVMFNRRGIVLKEKLWETHQIYVIDIANLLYLVSNHRKMKDKLVNLLNFSTENIIEKEIDFAIDLKPYRKMKKEDYGYVDQLKAIIPGKANASQYESYCVDVLKYLFNDMLSLWEKEKRSNDDLYRFDLICKIKNNINNEFFNTMEKYFSSKYIIFEFKNYVEEITQKEIYTTEKYLYRTALRTVAILLTRNGVDRNGMKAIKGTLRENGKLILVLEDRDIEQMIQAKEKGEDYTEILTNKLDEMLVTLEK